MIFNIGDKVRKLRDGGAYGDCFKEGQILEVTQVCSEDVHCDGIHLGENKRASQTIHTEDLELADMSKEGWL